MNAYSQATLAQGYIPQPRRGMNLRVEAAVKLSVLLPSGARYSVIEPCPAWGSEDLFGQKVGNVAKKVGKGWMRSE